MIELTKAEEEVMQYLWELKKAFVKDIIELYPEPKPAYNTVSTIVRILEKKGFVDHESFGKSHRYYPSIPKEVYKKQSVSKLAKGYFEGSFKSMVSFFLKEKKLSTSDLDEILRELNSEENELD
ncbi:BlaI/MecI/CopY family transcriptional regulator [Luteibaculum oceani]|uniref:BlaI/MecI/CopY family transcriptional regulator n=1 Tax=Luteibaculum oceani TaxID=1294296 RepID=A0A5C6UYX7_9FLAO|nr:BlaI/MecI/CopY family transcriptional regulator [Luteibaculum oceani]TXC78622.1 BlaI/MecI/CopY family transcriptional regulator [Luteibaculum oceani]